MIVELGNMHNYRTYVPKQDKNRLFLEKRLFKITMITLQCSMNGSVLLQAWTDYKFVWEVLKWTNYIRMLWLKWGYH